MKSPNLRSLPLALALLGASSCAVVPPAGTPGNELVLVEGAERIHWPRRYEPDGATFFVHNEIEVDAPVEVVWGVLMEATTWPDWYEGASDVRLEPEGTMLLQADSVLRWRTMGFSFRSEVVEFEPPLRLGWESRKATLKGYHAWLLVPLEDGRTRIVTDESQFGLLAVLQSWFPPGKLRRLHDVWLEAIKERAEARSTTTARSAARPRTRTPSA